MRKSLLSINCAALLALLVSSSAFAAPASREFVIHEEKKQCGVYWAGDEHTYYDLPAIGGVVEDF